MAKCSSFCQAFCTTALVFTWLVGVAGLAFNHVSLVNVVHKMEDFPETLRQGIDDELGFKSLEKDAVAVKSASKKGLEQCNAAYASMVFDSMVVTTCELAQAGGVNTYNEPPGTSIADIDAAFVRSLDLVMRVTLDKYLGTDALQDTANELSVVSSELSNMMAELTAGNGSVGCSVSEPSFCKMFKSADRVVEGVKKVNAELDSWTGSDWVDYYEQAADYFIYLHAVPYVAVLGALFFCCSWCKESCCSNGAGCCTGMFFITWFIVFPIHTIIVAVCIFMRHLQDMAKIDDGTLNGEPTLEELIDHVKATYPAFWDAVFADLEDGLIFFYYAALLLEAWLIITFAYVCCFCCSPYGNKDYKNESGD